VTPIRTATNTAGKAIGVGNLPWAIAITPNGKTAYVVNSGGTVTPIRTATSTAGNAINVGLAPVAIAITP
jgi:DNA-binding beta-propeller fold protein YncE